MQLRYLSWGEGERKNHLKYRVVQKERMFFQIIVTLFIFNIKNYVNTKKPVINAVLITYIDYSITENYRVAQKERTAFSTMSLGPHPHQIYLPAISFFGVTSNQTSAFENLVQSMI